MAPFLIVVSRAHPGLHAYLTQRFKDQGEIQVVIDRRLEERRRRAEGRARNRRRADRRAHAITEELRERSHVIVKLPQRP
jgi:hypothetical protein